MTKMGMRQLLTFIILLMIPAKIAGIRLDGDETSLTLNNLDEEKENIFAKCKDIAGDESRIIQFPDSSEQDCRCTNMDCKTYKGRYFNCR